jgi:hypothetical protein
VTSRQERERLKVLEKRREEHEQYAAERLAKVNEICALACKHGMSYGKYMIERDKIMEEENKVTQTQIAEEAPKKHGGIREPLPPEKVERVKEMLAEGTKISTIIAETLVSRATIDRIKNGTYGVKQPKKPPKAAEPAGVTTPEASKSDKRDILRRLILEVKCCLSSAPAFEDKEEGYVLGLLTAAELILGDNAKI